MIAHRLLPVMVQLHQRQRSVTMNALDDLSYSARRFGEEAEHGAFIGLVGRVYDMLLQYDQARAAFGASRIVVGVLPAQQAAPGEVSSVAAEDDAAARLARANLERLEEPVIHSEISP